jgi:hypothetical protein
MNDIPCMCGHDKEDHPKVGRYARYSGGAWGDYQVCDSCFRSNRPAGIKQMGTLDCEKYVPDNLSYIEWLANKKKLV